MAGTQTSQEGVMAGLVTLSRWMCEQPERLVAVHKKETVSTRSLVQQVLNWVTVLSDYRGSRCAVYHNDACDFLSILLALWQLDCTACIPGDNLPGTVDRLKGHVDAFVGEFPEGITLDRVVVPERPDEVEWRVPVPGFIALEIYTSGSTGEPKPITKTISQLEKEVDVLESQWPTRKDSVVISTVTHQHLYGMTFRLLWPFSTGRAFARRACQYLEDILYQAKHYNVFSLVASPSHLSRMNATVDWSEIAGRCDHVISSAAPLSREDSINVSSLLDTKVQEIYGSSETGAIAWREQIADKPDTYWTALPEVSLTANDEGMLVVKSPYLGDDEKIELPDKVEFLDDGRFVLKGRVDRIVKVEGKRISLSAIERALQDSGYVKTARATLIERKRIETGVVVQLEDEGTRILLRDGRKQLINHLKAGLREHFEAVVLPRRWRFVENMPYNALGKLPLKELQALFDTRSAEWPLIVSEDVSEAGARIRCYMQDELVYFDGHFENYPILPGIVQVHWAEGFGRRLLKIEGQFSHMEAVKFQKVIEIGMTIDITLNFDESAKKLKFVYQSDAGVHSSGRICFE